MTSIGSGTYHTIRGLGTKIFAHCKLNDRMMNTAVDGAMISSTVLLETPNEASKEKARVTRLGPITLLPSGFKIVTSSFAPDLKNIGGVIGMLASNLRNNVGVDRPDVTPEKGTKPPKTLGDSKNKQYREAKLEKADINLYYSTVDKMWTETMRRALKPGTVATDAGQPEAKAFKDSCIARGVPEEYLNSDKLEVSATRAIGMGSPALKAMITEELVGASGYFDEEGKDNSIRDFVAARVGYKNVNRYADKRNRNKIPTSQHTIASLENNDHRKGEPTIVGIDEPHVIHLLVHMDPMIDAAEEWIQSEGQMDAEPLSLYLGTALNHSAQHLDFLASDETRQEERATFMQQFQELAKLYQQMVAKANEQSNARQQKAEADAQVLAQAREEAGGEKLKIELAKIESDLALRVMKEQGIQKVREAKAIHTMNTKDALTNQQLRLNNLSTVTGE